MTVNFAPSQSSGSVVHDAITWAQANGVIPAALLSIIAFEGGPSTNQNCSGGATCSGYLQLNNSLFAGQYTPGNLFSELAVPGVGDRIQSTAQQYGSGWQQSFSSFWVAAQGGNPSGVPSSQFQTAVQQGLAWAGGASGPSTVPGSPSLGPLPASGGGGTGNLSDYFASVFGPQTQGAGSYPNTSTVSLPGDVAGSIYAATPVGAVTGLFGALLGKLTGKLPGLSQLQSLGTQLKDTFSRVGIFILGAGVIFVGAFFIAQRSASVQDAEKGAEKAAVAA